MKSGDRWTAWIKENGESFFLYARQQCRSDEDAKDVLQEALTETWERSGRKLPDRALVFATIRRRAIDAARSMDRRKIREVDFGHRGPDLFSPDFSANDVRRQLAKEVEALPDLLQEVLILRTWGGLTFPEIAQLLNTPVATVTSRYRYALERLRESASLTELKP
jgi:RNA polymerase sigma-70 factor (ECF subfamily)